MATRHCIWPYVLRAKNRRSSKLCWIMAAKPNVANSDGDTPLHLAVRHNSGAIDLLLKRPNIDPSIKNRQNETPVDLASSKKLYVYRQAAAKMRTIISAQKGSQM
jgi:Ankyrin repeats (3 copies)